MEKSINYTRKIAEMSAKKSINYAINIWFSWETNIQWGENHMLFESKLAETYKEKTCRDVDEEINKLCKKNSRDVGEKIHKLCNQ